MKLPYNLKRDVTIQAAPETVFGFFTDNARWASWWGAGSTIEPRPGGAIYIRHPNGVENSGEVLEIRPPDQIVFSFGYPSGKPYSPEESRVTIQLARAGGVTRLSLFHELADEAARDQLIQGWRFQLSVFGNVVANQVYSGVQDLVDEWFGLYTIADEAHRRATIARLTDPAVTMRDRFSMLEGHEDLCAHMGAAQKFMPGLRWERRGNVRHCQGTVLAEWAAVAADGSDKMKGTNVFQFGSNGTIQSVIGLNA